MTPEGDTQINSWQVKVTDLHHPRYDTILRMTPDGSSNAKEVLGWLNPSRFYIGPITAKRAVKVNGFYIVADVKSYHFTRLDSPYLDSMVVDVTLTNTDPRTKH